MRIVIRLDFPRPAFALHQFFKCLSLSGALAQRT